MISHVHLAKPGFRCSMFIAYALSLIAAHAAATSTWQIITHEVFYKWLHVSLVLLGMGSLLVVSLILARRPFSGEKTPWWTIPMAVFGGQWSAMSVHLLIEHGMDGVSHWIVAFGAIIVFLIAMKWLHATSHEHGHITDVSNLALAMEEDDREVSPPPMPRVLICLVSPPVNTTFKFPNEPNNRPCVVSTTTTFDRQGTCAPPVTLSVGISDESHDQLLADIESLSSLRINWQQLLRVFRDEEVRNIPKVVFVGENRDWLKLAKRWVEPYLPNASFQTEVVERLDDVNLLYDSLKNLIERLGEEPERVMVDVTGGFAVSSIAAAALTVRNKTRIQWVPTYDAAKRGEDNRHYDLRTFIRPLPEH